MMTSNELSLITAAVDGEISSEQARACRRLFADQPAAAKLFRQLKADAARVKAYPRATAPLALTATIMAHVATLPAHQPIVPSTAVPMRRVVTSLPYAVAASILLSVVFGSFWVFSPDRGDKDRAETRIEHLPAPKPLPPDRREPILTDYVVARPDDSLISAAVIPMPRLVPDPTPIVIAKLHTELAPLPRPAGGDVVGFNLVEKTRPLTAVELRLPFITQAIDFDKPDVSERLTAEFALDPAYRLDLMAKNPQVAIDLLLAAVKSSGATVSIDAATQERLTKKMPITTALYLEGLTPAEVVTLLGQLGKGVQAATPAAIGAANLVPALAQEQRDVRDLFGVDLGLLRTPRGNGTSSASPGKSVANDTIGQIANNMKKGTDKQAILLTYLPPGLRTPVDKSKEVKAFLDRRSERKSGTIPLLIVLRPTAN